MVVPLYSCKDRNCHEEHHIDHWAAGRLPIPYDSIMINMHKYAKQGVVCKHIIDVDLNIDSQRLQLLMQSLFDIAITDFIFPWSWGQDSGQ